LAAKEAWDTLPRPDAVEETWDSHAIFNMPDVYEMTQLQTFAKEIIPAVAER
jgi:hypothetical protein